MHRMSSENQRRIGTSSGRQEFYTAGAVAGEEGERLRSLLAENANRAGEGDPD